MMLRWILRMALVIALVWGWYVAVTPSTMRGDWFAHADKLRHAAAFAVFMGWCMAAAIRPYWLCATVLLAYGVGIEWAQSFVPGREASIGDILADAAGILFGWWLYRRMSALFLESAGLRPETRTPPANPW